MISWDSFTKLVILLTLLITVLKEVDSRFESMKKWINWLLYKWRRYRFYEIKFDLFVFIHTYIEYTCIYMHYKTHVIWLFS